MTIQEQIDEAAAEKLRIYQQEQAAAAARQSNKSQRRLAWEARLAAFKAQFPWFSSPPEPPPPVTVVEELPPGESAASVVVDEPVAKPTFLNYWPIWVALLVIAILIGLLLHWWGLSRFPWATWICLVLFVFGAWLLMLAARSYKKYLWLQENSKARIQVALAKANASSDSLSKSEKIQQEAKIKSDNKPVGLAGAIGLTVLGMIFIVWGAFAQPTLTETPREQVLQTVDATQLCGGGNVVACHDEKQGLIRDLSDVKLNQGDYNGLLQRQIDLAMTECNAIPGVVPCTPPVVHYVTAAPSPSPSSS